MNSQSTASLQEHVRIVYAAFTVAAVGSFGYCIAFDQFNGDFFPQPVFLSVFSLLWILILCLIPYLAVWRLADFVDRLKPRRVFEPSSTALLLLLLAGFGAHIAVTLLFGVGVMSSEVYSAPPLIRPFIQVLNRLDPFYLGSFFILATRKRASTDLLAISLMLGTGFLRAGLGAFVYVLIAISIKYRLELINLARRVPWLIASVCLALPSAISALYELRTQLRGEISYDYSLSETLMGRFLGRLSSYSNVAYIEQFEQSFAWSAKSLEPLFYIKQGLSSLLGNSIVPSLTPERILIAGNRAYEGYSTFMAGVPGNLMLAWHLSPWVALLNATIILGTTFAILWLSRYLGGATTRTFGMAMVVYPLTSGVANEFAILLLNTAAFVVFSIIFATQRSRATVHGR